MFKLGCDPEIFLVDAKEALVASCGLIGGTKEYPRPLVNIGEGYAIQEDNVAVEFNIPPAESKQQWLDAMEKAMAGILSEVQVQGLHFSKESAASFPKSQLLHPAAREFGCDPDYNAWANGNMNPKPKAEDETLRSCGGHLHIGIGKCPSKSKAIELVKLMDKHGSVPAVLMDRGWLRKKLYGKPGAFRPKPYGLEYRSLSNFWIFDAKYREWAYDITVKAVTDWENENYVGEEEGQMIQEAINNNNQNLASVLVEKHNLLVV